HGSERHRDPICGVSPRISGGTRNANPPLSAPFHLSATRLGDLAAPARRNLRFTNSPSTTVRCPDRCSRRCLDGFPCLWHESPADPPPFRQRSGSTRFGTLGDAL